MKILLLLSIFVTGSIPLFAQDLITTRKGEDLKARVLEIGLINVKYHLWDAPEGAVSILPKSEILLIRYEDGGKEVFESQTAEGDMLPTAVPQNKSGLVSSLSNTNMFIQGQIDAKRYYKGYKDAGAVSLISSFLLGPVFGLIPTIAIASTTPNAQNLDFPSESLMRNREYAIGYAKEARSIKSRRSWTNYGIGAVIGTALLAILISVSLSNLRLGP